MICKYILNYESCVLLDIEENILVGNNLVEETPKYVLFTFENNIIVKNISAKHITSFETLTIKIKELGLI